MTVGFLVRLESRGGLLKELQPRASPGLLNCCPVRSQDQGPGPGAVFLSWFPFSLMCGNCAGL